MAWTVAVARSAQKQLAKFPASDQRKIAEALLSLEADPDSGDTLKLEGSTNRFRRRVGSYQVFFAINAAAKLVAVSAIVWRTSTTY